MILKNALVSAFCAGFVVVMSTAAMADEYRPNEYLGLDLSKAVLSPKRLGPPAEFAPVAVEAKSDRSVETPSPRAEAPGAPDVAARPVRARTVHAAAPRSPARAKLARRNSNPLDAQARDTRIQTWPCRSGPLCKWQ
jgi:hypothetical protein